MQNLQIFLHVTPDFPFSGIGRSVFLYDTELQWEGAFVWLSREKKTKIYRFPLTLSGKMGWGGGGGALNKILYKEANHPGVQTVTLL